MVFRFPLSSPLRRYLFDPVAAQLRQGTTPEKIVLSIVVGASLSVFPVLGVTTSLCVLAGMLLRLNHPVMQLVNYLVYPLQLALIFVFIRVGESVFRAPRLPFSVSELSARFHASPVLFFREFAVTLIYGAVAWLIIVPPVALMVYFALRPVVRAVARKTRSKS
jgi:uncharacterized protein (DUF2062 family)